SLLRFGPLTGINTGADGNIYLVSDGYRATAGVDEALQGGIWNRTKAFIHVLNPENGELIDLVEVAYERVPGTVHTPNRPGITEDGFVALSFVFPASPIVILDPNDNWNVLNTVTTDKKGFSRSFEVSNDGTMIFNPQNEADIEGGTPVGIHVYEAESVFDEYSFTQVLAAGTKSGSISRYPNSDIIFFTGGGVDSA